MTALPKHVSRPVGADLEIRRARSDDLPEILALLAEMHDQTADASTDAAEIFRQIAASPTRALLVAVKGEAIVGTLDLFVVPNLSRGARPWAGIENLVVAQAHRRQGIGRALVDVAVDLAAKARCYKVQLVSHERRTAAHDLYRRAGFDAPVHGYRRYL